MSLISRFVPSFRDLINPEKLLIELFNRMQPGFGGAYIPADQYEEGLKGEEKDKFANANPLNIKWEKLPGVVKELVKDAFYKELVRSIPAKYLDCGTEPVAVGPKVTEEKAKPKKEK